MYTHAHTRAHTHINGVFLYLCSLLAFGKARWIRYAVDFILTVTHTCMYTHTHMRARTYTQIVLLYLCRLLAFSKSRWIR